VPPESTEYPISPGRINSSELIIPLSPTSPVSPELLGQRV